MFYAKLRLLPCLVPNNVGDASKRLKKLHKKLRQLDQLRAKQKEGKALQDDEIEKIKYEPNLRNQISAIQRKFDFG
jgi:uncharacterized protein with WD repeat